MHSDGTTDLRTTRIRKHEMNIGACTGLGDLGVEGPYDSGCQRLGSIGWRHSDGIATRRIQDTSVILFKPSYSSTEKL